MKPLSLTCLLLAACGDTPSDTADSDADTDTDTDTDTDSDTDTDTDTDSGGCDDPFPALCVVGQTLEGDPMLPASVEIYDPEAVLVEELACGPSECCTYSLSTGHYQVIAVYGEERLSQEADVENSYACDHEVTTLSYTFDVAR